jgi:hypothetical protein
MHFILKCPYKHQGFRSHTIADNVYKHIQLMSSNNLKDLCNLSKLIFQALKFRSDML